MPFSFASAYEQAARNRRERLRRESGIDELISQLKSQQAQARAANIKREKEIRELYGQQIERYQPGGEFGKGYEAELERERTKFLSSGMQSLVSSGLANTTMAAGLSGKFAEEVAAPARLKLEDLRMERLSQAERAKAGFIERIEDVGPSSELIASLVSKASQIGMGRGFTSTLIMGKPKTFKND